jgi:hypothetical protein
MLKIFSGGTMDALSKAPAATQTSADPAGFAAIAAAVPDGAVPAASPGLLSVGLAPAWLVKQMPPGYQTRFAEIQRLSAEIQGMDRMGRLLWEAGPALREAVRELFVSLRLDVDPAPAATGQLTVRLDATRRLLLHVAEVDSPIQKKSPELARVFHTLHEVAGEGDRVVLVSNSHRAVAPTERPQPMAADALDLLKRLGANFVASASLFNVWSLAQLDVNRARVQMDRLHAQDGGVFVPSTS